MRQAFIVDPATDACVAGLEQLRQVVLVEPAGVYRSLKDADEWCVLAPLDRVVAQRAIKSHDELVFRPPTK